MILGVGLVLLGLTTYISTLAYALRSYSRAQLAGYLRNGQRERWVDWLDDYEWELQTIVGLLRLVLSLSVLLTIGMWYEMDLGAGLDVRAPLLAGLIAVLTLGVFAVAIPHALATHAGEVVLAHSLPLLATLRILFWPFGRFYVATEFVVRRLLGKAEVSDEEESERAEQEILEAVDEGEAHGAVDEDQREMIKSVFELDETPVSTIMTPRTDINAVSADATYDDVRSVILEKGHSRIPVYEGSVDHIIGIVYAKDLLRLDPHNPFDARQIMRTAPYVPETKPLDELLADFRTSKVQIAIVLDEYGGTAGLATLEDILEELVGEIDDEYDEQPPPAIIRVDEDTLEVDARVHICEINEELEVELPEEEDYETIGGFVFATLGKIPTAGEEFRHENIHFHVIAAEARKINRLRIHVERRAESA